MLPLSPFQAALAANQEELNQVQSEICEIQANTIQTQQEGISALQDRIALLEAQLEDSRRETARVIADRDAATVANAAMARQSASQQTELSYLRPREMLLRGLIRQVQEINRVGVPKIESEIQREIVNDPDIPEGLRGVYAEQATKSAIRELWKPLIEELSRQNL